MDITVGTAPGMIRCGLTTVGLVHLAFIMGTPGITDGAGLITTGTVHITAGIPTLEVSAITAAGTGITIATLERS